MGVCLVCLLTEVGWSEHTIVWDATHGFVTPDGEPVFSGNTGGYAAQLLWAPGLPSCGQIGASSWRSLSGGTPNPASGQVLLQSVTNYFDKSSIVGVYGVLPVQRFEGMLPGPGGYVFVRVFSRGSDSPGNVPAFDQYYESEVLDVEEVLEGHFQINRGTADFLPDVPDPYLLDVIDFPSDPVVPVDIGSIGLDQQGRMAFGFQGFSGSIYRLEYTRNLTAADPQWIPVGDTVDGVCCLWIYLRDPEFYDDPSRIYRIVTVGEGGAP